MKPIISVEGLGKSYTIRHEGQTNYKSLREEIFKLPKRLLQRNSQNPEEFWALKDVSFDVMPGDRLGIIGRNGAGKSTLLKLLSRITEPTTGRITLRGRVASLLEVGTGFHPELTGRENIFLNGAILGMSRAEVRRKFDEIVDFAGVEKFLDTPVKRYSSGMYVRLAFAVAAHLEPEILIVDEVLAVGDAEFQEKSLGKMEEASKDGRTVLFVSHNMASLGALCTQGLFLDNGKIKLYENIKNVISSYLCAKQLLPAEAIERIGGIQACITSVTANTYKTESLANIKIIFSIKSMFDLREPHLGFSIHDEIGKSIFIYYLEDCRIQISTGENTIEVRFPFPLNPGKYTIRCRLTSIGETVDYPIGDVASFVVPPETTLTSHPETLKNGLLRLPVEVKIKKGSQLCRS